MRDEYLLVNEWAIELYGARSLRNFKKIQKELVAENPFPFELDSLTMYNEIGLARSTVLSSNLNNLINRRTYIS